MSMTGSLNRYREADMAEATGPPPHPQGSPGAASQGLTSVQSEEHSGMSCLRCCVANPPDVPSALSNHCTVHCTQATA